MKPRFVLVPTFVLGMIAAGLPFLPGAAAQNDAGTGGDAGNTLAAATSIAPYGEYTGYLAGGTDKDDYYKFTVALGASINIEVRDVLLGGSAVAPDNTKRLSFRLLGPNGALIDTPNTIQGDTRVTLAAAPLAGTYYFRVTTEFGGFTGNYRFCGLAPPPLAHPCPDIGMDPQNILYGGLLDTDVHVLVIPPTHGDLGNPFGPSVTDYLTATIEGIREWERVIDDFIADYPAYSSLNDINVQIQVFDSAMVTADYDIVITFVESGGTQFRGVASSCLNPPRCIALSLYSVASRSGQALPDYPEYNDLEAVVKHEFAHTFGLGHTLTWTTTFGPDLMNSPAPFVYGDGSPVGDGGERTGKKCVSTLNLYVLWQARQGVSSGWFNLPSGLPYAWYC